MSDAPRDPLTVQAALNRGTRFLRSLGMESARLEMELILAEVLGLDRLGVYMNMARPLGEAERERARELLGRRSKREPLAYILGAKEFYGLRFEVTPAVLIPRPETELIVDRVIDWLKSREPEAKEPRLADIGTGSGAIAVASAAMQARGGLPGRWVATDISERAIEVARANAAYHKVLDRIDWKIGSLLEPLTGPVDCLCANPPYIADHDAAALEPEVRDWEPAEALYGGPDGTEYLRCLIRAAPDFLHPGGMALIEIGLGQKPFAEKLIGETPGLDGPRFHADLQGIPRLIETRRT